MSTPDYQLLSSIRWDPKLIDEPLNIGVDGPSPFFLLKYHFDRLVDAAQDFGWTHAILLLAGDNGLRKLKQDCQRAVEEYDGPNKNDGLRIRTMISHDGRLTTDAFPVSPLTAPVFHAVSFDPTSPAADSFSFPSPILSIYINPEPTPKSIYTINKTTSRASYDGARDRFGIKSSADPREVLLWNEEGEVDEATIRNVAFWRDGGWVTPRLESGCLPGIVRRWLVENGKVKEGIIMKDDVKVGEWVLTFNGAQGCLLGKIIANPEGI